MQIFFGYFIWGLILAAPLSWVVWRFRLQRFLPRITLPERRRATRLPPQLGALVIRGVRRRDSTDAPR